MVGDHHGARVLDDDELNATLESLGLGRRHHRAVVLMPLIEVAWADGRIQKEERLRIVQIARQFGMDGKSEWLARQLRRKPSRKMFLAARTALLDLMARAGKADPASEESVSEPPVASLDQLLDWCNWIAEASGGLFGLAFTVEQSERDCIEQIAASLSLGPAVPDGLVEQWEQARRRHFLAEAPTNMRRRGPRYGILDQTTAHLNFSALTTVHLETPPPEGVRRKGSTSPTLDPPLSSKPTLDPAPPPAPVAKERRSARPQAKAPSKPAASPPPPPPPSLPEGLKSEVAGKEALKTEPMKTSPMRADALDSVRLTPGEERALGERSAETPSLASGRKSPGKSRAPAPTPPPPPVPAHLAAVSRPSIPASELPPKVRASLAGKKSAPSAAPRSTRSVDEDPTLPFFDDVNVGTYVEPSE